MNQQNSYVIGVDLGGTNTVCGVVDRGGRVVAQSSIHTGDYATAAAFVAALTDALQPLIGHVGGLSSVRGIGVGAPNANFYTGTINHAPNLPWRGVVPLAQMISQSVQLPVRMTNDANAAALGEMKYGAARGMRDFIVITLGTGVGSGIVCGGNLLYGHDGFAGELGHVRVVRENGRLCGCGRTGCLEAYCSATGVARTARELLATTQRPSTLRTMPPDVIQSVDVARAAEEGDALAREIFDFTGRLLGEACADFTAFSSPEAYIFFGGLTKAGELLMRPVREAYDRTVMPIFRGKAKFLLSGLADANAAVLGASALGWDA